MQNKLLEKLFDFVNQYKGPKLNIVIYGGGVSLLEIAKVPGSSKVLEAGSILYDIECGENAAVSQQAVLDAMYWQSCDDCINIVCSASLTTNRYRQGENHAWLAITHAFPDDEENIYTKHLELTKLSEKEYQTIVNLHGQTEIHNIRVAEDEQLSLMILNEIEKFMAKHEFTTSLQQSVT